MRLSSSIYLRLAKCSVTARSAEDVPAKYDSDSLAAARSQDRTPPAFTIVEALLVIALVAVLLALLTPSLSGAREAARRTVTLSHLRTHANIMTVYANDNGEMLPYTTYPEATYTVRRHPSGYVRQFVYFGGYNNWHWPLLDDYYSGTLDNALFSQRTNDDNYPFATLWYSASFLATPEFWNPTTRTGLTQWRPTRLSDVTFASKKGLLFNRDAMFPLPDERPDPLHRVEIAFVDAAARPVRWHALSAPYFNGEGNWHGSWFVNGIKVMHTIDGVRGRDEQ